MALDIRAAKAVVLVSIYVISLFFVMIPRLLTKVPKIYQEFIISVAQAFSGGVFLAAALLDMLPGGIEDINDVVVDRGGESAQQNLGLQVTFTIFISGFLLIFFIEKIWFIKLLNPTNKYRDKTHDIEQVIPESMSDTEETSLIIQNHTDSEIGNLTKRGAHEHGFTLECLTDHEDILFMDDPKTLSHQSLNTEQLNPIDVLQKTLSHGFEFIPVSKKDKVKIALEVVEETFSVKFAKMAEDNPLMYVSLTLVLSVHTMIAGIAMGVCTDTDCLWGIYIGVMSHLWVVALALGISIHRSKVKLRIHVGVAFFWSSMLPIGLIMGSVLVMFLSDNWLLFIQGFFVTLAAGTFIYVAVVDVILQEFTSLDYRYFKFFLLVVGFVFMGILLLLFGG